MGPLDPNDPNQPVQIPGYAGYAANPQNLLKVAPAVMTTPNQPTPFAKTSASMTPPAPKLFSSTPNPIPAPGGVGTPGGVHLSQYLNQPQSPQSYQDWSTQNPQQLAQPIAQKHPKLFALTAALEGLSGAINHDPAAGVNYVNQVRQHDESLPQVNFGRYQQQVIQPFQTALNMQDTESQIQQRGAETKKADAETAAIPENQRLRRLGVESQAGAHGLKIDTDEQGNMSLVPDPDSPVYQKQQHMNDYLDSRQRLAQAQADLADAKTKNQPVLIEQAQRRLELEAQNTRIAGERLGLSEQEFGFNQDKFYNPQPGETQRNRADLGKSALLQIQTMRDIINRRKDVFGPVGGRVTNANQWIGSSDPDAAKYRAAQSYLAEHSTGMMGSRNGEVMKHNMDLQDPRFNPAALLSSLDQAEKTSNEFVKAGTLHSAPTGGALGGGQPSGKQLDQSSAQKFLQQAGGDKNKARQLAKQAGYAF